MATKFTAATPLIPYHRRMRKPRGDVFVQQVHIDCSPSIRCQKTSLLPKRTRLTHIASNQGKPKRTAGNTNPGRPASGSSIRLACRPVATFVVALVPWCHPGRQRVRTALPGGIGTHRAYKFRLCLRKDHRPTTPVASATEIVGYLLAAHSQTVAFEARR